MASTQPAFYHSTVAPFLRASKGVWSAFLLFHMWVASFPSTNLTQGRYQEEFRGGWMTELSHQQMWMHSLSASSITDRLYPSCLTRNQPESTSELLLLFSIWPKLGSSYQVFGASWIRASPLQLCCCQPDYCNFPEVSKLCHIAQEKQYHYASQPHKLATCSPLLLGDIYHPPQPTTGI